VSLTFQTVSIVWCYQCRNCKKKIGKELCILGRDCPPGRT